MPLICSLPIFQAAVIRPSLWRGLAKIKSTPSPMELQCVHARSVLMCDSVLMECYLQELDCFQDLGHACSALMCDSVLMECYLQELDCFQDLGHACSALMCDSVLMECYLQELDCFQDLGQLLL